MANHAAKNNLKEKASKITQIMHVGIAEDEQHYAIAPPLYMTSTYSFEALGKPRACDYGRTHNPNRDILAKAVSILEGGACSTIVSSGMAAVHLPVQAFMEHNDLIIAPKGSYGSTIRLFNSLQDKGYIRVKWVDFLDFDLLQDVIATEKPRMVFMETISNPLLRTYDIEEIAKLTQRHDALLVVDNTFTPGVVFPLELGADVVLHSATKYLNGHSDIVAGTVTAKTEQHGKQLAHWANNAGTTAAPFDAYQIMRGMRTLFERMEKHQATALKIATFLGSHDAVETVYYPGLPSAQGYAALEKYGHGFGAMVTFDLKGDLDTVRTFIERLNWFSLAVSLGGFESLVCHPPTMTHSGVQKDILAEAGITDNTVRLAIGLEEADDLIDDLTQALA